MSWFDVLDLVTYTFATWRLANVVAFWLDYRATGVLPDEWEALGCER